MDNNLGNPQGDFMPIFCSKHQDKGVEAFKNNGDLGLNANSKKRNAK